MYDKSILTSFGLSEKEYDVRYFGTGLINNTFKVTGNKEAYILQQVNSDVFKSPQDITKNLILIRDYLIKHNPEYLFVGQLPAASGDLLVIINEGKYYRLFPFIKGSQTINFISDEKEAFEAARQFGQFTYLLKNFEPKKLKRTLADFHNLKLRFQQFELANNIANTERAIKASDEIREVYKHKGILQTYNMILANNEIPERIIHHDTKISNVLFDEGKNGLCVIDLDTVMPGYFFSDVGDMMRTYLSPGNEEEIDLEKIYIREAIFSAICKGYLSQMGKILTKEEKNYFVFSGELMIYMQAIRFLTDYLNNDIYYGSKYPGHNLNRAKNQFKLLNEYLRIKDKLENLVTESEKELEIDLNDFARLNR